jgi:hypothetical protein
MLRRALALVSVAVLATTLVLLACGVRGVWPGAVWSGLIVVALLIERWRYAPNAGADREGDWVKTDERFIDPESGRAVEVLYNPRTGERRYAGLSGPDSTTTRG